MSALKPMENKELAEAAVAEVRSNLDQIWADTLVGYPWLAEDPIYRQVFEIAYIRGAGSGIGAARDLMGFVHGDVS